MASKAGVKRKTLFWGGGKFFPLRANFVGQTEKGGRNLSLYSAPKPKRSRPVLVHPPLEMKKAL